MSNYDEELKSEVSYLENTMSLINKNLDIESNKASKAKEELIYVRRHMWENTVHFIDDIDRLADIKQNLAIVQGQTTSYEKIEKNIDKYKRMLKKPYFARIDFLEKGSYKEKIYIGVSNLLDEETYDFYVYDWRSPVASIFYRYELGNAKYNSPDGEVEGEVLLKRQYDIKNGKINYFFDSSLNIMDNTLKSVLAKNTSSKMKTIVETIQREQDIVIRDIESELLIVQGVAGSGKTSIAMHRVAFLMYQGLLTKLYANNIVIISPNELFSKYIENVLPELGEENIIRLTFENIFSENFNNRCIKSKNDTLEEIIVCEHKKKKNIIKSSLEFKTSKEFVTILNRFIWYFQRKMIDFRDIYYNGEYMANRHLIKEFLLNDSIDIPIEKRLKTIEVRILDKIKPIRKERIKKLEAFVSRYPEHQFEIKSLARLISIKESSKLLKEIKKFTQIDYINVYKRLLQNKDLFYRLAQGIRLPDNIDDILNNSSNNEDAMLYEDILALTYLKVKISGYDKYKDIKQVVVDEAQDYYPIHFEILKEMFKNARYTVLGDINQTIGKEADICIYDDIKAILNKSKSTVVSMHKSFRNSYEINEFSSKFLHENFQVERFERHEEPPEIVSKLSVSELDETVINYILKYKEYGCELIAIICKSMKQSQNLYERLKDRIEINIITNKSNDISGTSIVPVYMAKGLEFDGVIVYGTDDENYNTEEDKKLLYIACTRALHRLSLVNIGDKSRFII
ncbi:DNA helicase-2/ATP-dependent DNA helicase PcrA [Clostridium tetanomorphum]|uniref:DNA 3'-5' helicase n=1 Tax=Clostridium tetanomorphum TaxID=1553 RepID=A0A923E5B3_CLOTT|nr:UvrD-helicase domain-containing protein [Clostridium tetanomorphum]KAJ52710.1 ATP-dependent DNA helicase replicase [Clostridium tetanomorphum DSM 665]MBC2396737.1 AAA family ATPase [Clostridium tetanomorphum]MBP1863303.1 DNA helicase-2/ATP-dependent DNA helicase PcrA [Clostridium tetanomorphum]NRS84411.1 DNA helicase-2/ATP-dependent DNA helicase PcrA [Clostridium tetanomorphum]NRZ97626.1 DNA helicase-2/ATP-dependent DNA helicase PcrA [Clostridium tetanomorphum]